ncbi:MAG TPA: glycosyltransferase family 9 protein [Candidatus Binatia bacterium]|nr:glycosyltransferase family 9 protein [Candidatus Binatia bacterium]
MKSLPNTARVATQRNVCVLFPGALGDFICFAPTLQLLAEAAHVDVYARSEFADLVPKGITVHSLEQSAIRKLFTAEVETDEEAQCFFGNYSTVYSWFGSQQADFVRRITAASFGRAQIFPFRPAGARVHQVDHYLSCLRVGGTLNRQPVIELRAEAIRWRVDFWRKQKLNGHPVLVIGAGSGAREKNWPEEFLVRVVKWWRTATRGNVVLPVGPVEQERGGIERLSRYCVTVSGLGLAELAALIAGSDLYLGNDSGVSHLAAAVAVRTVALFGPSDIEQWAPRGTRVTIVRHSVHCSPCETPAMKNCPHRSCLTALLPDEVIQALAQLPEVLTLTRG